MGRKWFAAGRGDRARLSLARRPNASQYETLEILGHCAIFAHTTGFRVFRLSLAFTNYNRGRIVRTSQLLSNRRSGFSCPTFACCLAAAAYRQRVQKVLTFEITLVRLFTRNM